MKISYNWLKSYLDIELEATEVAKLLTDTGLEVEGIDAVESIKGGLKGVIVGEVLSKEKHDNADKLNVTQVNIGAENNLQIVCGAPNVAVGQKVLIATVGAILYPSPEESFPIKKAKIRGIESSGMICAEDELGIGKSHDGILVLPEEIEVGTAASAYYNIKTDTVFEIGLTPNRTDALGHIGVARDLKAALKVLKNENLQLNLPAIYSETIGNSADLKLTIENTQSCPYYSGTIVKNIQTNESPEWLQESLEKIGQKSINAIVDITNYVMFETGQPLHAFDLNATKGNIIVRNAVKDEPFISLDEIDRKLNENDLVIANFSDPMCMAGVFGGIDSGVKSTTKSLFLEAAYFDSVAVRKMAKRHGLNTDSSFRFERGTDPQNVDFAMRRALFLIQEVCGGTIEGMVKNGALKEAVQVTINLETVNKTIGHVIPREKVLEILNELEFIIIEETKESLLLKVPTYRVDVTREIDVIEEILRIYGFNNIPIPTKLNTSISLRPSPDKEKLYNLVSDLLVNKGFSEIMNNSLTSYEDDTNTVALLNPLSIELKHLRKEMLTGGLKNIVHNQNRQYPDLKFFEFGKTYQFINNNYIENECLGIWITGVTEEENWNTSSPAKTDAFEIKGITESILAKLGIAGIKYKKKEENIAIYSGKRHLGNLVNVTSEALKKFGIKNPVYFVQLNWKELVTISFKSSVKYKTLAKTQFVRRDFSLLLNKDVQFNEIRKIAFAVDSNTLQKVGLFDVYEGKNLDTNKKSYAVSFFFQDKENTLKDAVVDNFMTNIRAKLEKELSAELR